MQLTHHGQSCLLIELDGLHDGQKVRLLTDPGSFSGTASEVCGLDAVLITHNHADHLDPELLAQLRANNPDMVILADPATTEQLTGEGEQVTELRAGQDTEIAGVQLTGVGGTHAVIHPEIPVIDNVGLLIRPGPDGPVLYHPGDCLEVPDVAVDVLLAPTAAPWLDAQQAVEFIRAVAPRVAIPVHQAVLSAPDIWHGLMSSLAPQGTEVMVLERGTATAV